jgi:hypothetical protein
VTDLPILDPRHRHQQPHRLDSRHQSEDFLEVHPSCCM